MNLAYEAQNSVFLTLNVLTQLKFLIKGLVTIREIKPLQ